MSKDKLREELEKSEAARRFLRMLPKKDFNPDEFLAQELRRAEEIKSQVAKGKITA